MGRMVRKQVYIEPEQDEFLKRRAKEMGVTESDMIRQAIVGEMQRTMPMRREGDAPDGLASAPSGTAHFQGDSRAWQEEVEFMLRRAELPHQKPPPVKRGWTREELYEERLNQISRRH